MEVETVGRSGGSGGRSSGGSFGGSRSSGGRSGGSFGSSGRSGGVFGGGTGPFGGSGASGPLGGTGRSPGGTFGGGFNPINMGGRRPVGGGMPGGLPGGGRSGGGGCGGCGCSIAVLALVLVIIIAVLLISNLGSVVNNVGSGPGITTSSVQRVPLPKGSVNETGYYYDELDWIGNETELVRGLKYFYDKTGVQPYLYITDNVNGLNRPSTGELDAFANGLYDELFTDEAHLLFVFFEYDESYMTRYVLGTQAKTVIDTEAADILLDYVDRYYFDNSLTDEEFFSKSFTDAADRIMTVTKSPWISVLLVFGVAVVLMVLFIWWRLVKKQKNLEAKRMEEILNTPLDQFGNKEADDLAKKYEDQDPDR
jgi:hypothetical protein